MTRRNETDGGVGKFIAVPSLPSETAGAIVLWRLSGEVNYTALAAEWEKRGLDARLLPALPSPTVALHRAVEGQRGPRRLVRPLGGRNGWAVVAEKAEEDDLDYSIQTRVKLDTAHRIVIDPAEGEMAVSLRAAFDHYLDTLVLGDISEWLCDRVVGLHAVPLRDTGGVYFIPRSSVADWQRMASALEAASDCVCHEIAALQTAEAVECILDAVAQEVENEAAAMEKEINDLGERGLRNRMEHCEKVEAKIELYEGLLGAKQEALHERLTRLKASIGAAILKAGSADEEVMG